MTDYTSLITSEHSDKPNFVATVDFTANAIGDITALIQSLPGEFDLDVAIASQLDVDGQWIGFSRAVGGILLVQFFGFADDITSLGFGELGNAAIGGRFIELGEDATTTSTLADPEYRLTLDAKILQNFWDGSVSQFEAAAEDLIPVPCQFIDPGIRVVAIFPSALLDQTLYQLLTTYDLLPRPAGVRYQLFQPLSTPYAWTTAGTALANGTTVSKPTGVAAWDSSAFIADPSVSASISFQITGNNINAMVGLAANPSGSPNYPTLNAALYIVGGALQIYRSGTLVASVGFAPVGATYQVYFDKSRFVVLVAGIVVYMSEVINGISLSPTIVMQQPGGDSIVNINVQLGT